MVVRLRHTLIPGRARVPPAGERVLAIANFASASIRSTSSSRQEKSVSARRRNQHARRVRYLEEFAAAIFLFPGASSQTRDCVFAIEFGDKTCADFRGANRFAFVGVRAITETFCVHLPHHFCHARSPFRRPLRQKCEMRNFCGGEKHGRCIRAGRGAGSATDAGGCTGSKSYTLTVVCSAITVSPSSLSSVTRSLAYTKTFTASGGLAPYAFATGGPLPPGLTLLAGGNGLSNILGG